MKAAMKAMKKGMKKSSAKKGMKKAMRKKRVSKVGKKWRVFAGLKEKTVGGLKKSDLVRSKSGKVVSKKASLRAKAAFKKNGLFNWMTAVQKARKAMGVKGFCAVGGKTTQGQALLKKARSFYKK